MARRLSSPVSGSVSACSCDLAIARSTPRRVPTWAATPSSRSIDRRRTTRRRRPGAVAWMTAVGVPRIVIGTHTAEHGSPPRSGEARARREVVAALEVEGAALANGGAAPRRLDPAAGRLAARRDRGPAEVGAAGVGDEQLGRARARRPRSALAVTSSASASVSPMSSASCTSRRNACCCDPCDHLGLAGRGAARAAPARSRRIGRAEVRNSASARQGDVDRRREHHVGDRRHRGRATAR